jgi:hypothetical protein
VQRPIYKDAASISGSWCTAANWNIATSLNSEQIRH